MGDSIRRLKINEIKEKLKQKNYLVDKTIIIDDILSNHKYEFQCDEGHRFFSYPINVYQNDNNVFTCPICSGRRTTREYNNIIVDAPEIAIYLKNKEDGYLYSTNSNKKLNWKCPYCGNEFSVSPNRMMQRKNKCTKCGDINSYCERFIAALLDLWTIPYVEQKKFDWSDGKIYDFYLKEYNCIIEMQGKQHYENGQFSYSNSRTLCEEQCNDFFKKENAIKNGIEHYYEINCIQQTPEYIYNNIMISGLSELLFIPYNKDDVKECDYLATSKKTLLLCNEYMNGTHDLHKLGDMFDIKSINTVREKLKKGASFGWCDYSVEEAKKNGTKKLVESMLKRMSKPVKQIDMDGNIVHIFPSLNEAQRTMNSTRILDCVHGRKETVCGFRWEYV